MVPGDSKAEYPPLLPEGLHPKSLEELEAMCDGAFPLSSTRKGIMDALARLYARIVNAGIGCEMWIDGSFLTEKIDPADVDLAVRFQVASYDDGDATQRAAIDFVSEQKEPLCDSYVWFEYPEGHAHEFAGAESRDYWRKWFGTARSGDAKGIAVVAVSGGLST